MTSHCQAETAACVLRAIGTTRSIHRYRPRPVSDDDLEAVLWAATRAPSGGNLQPFRFVVLRDGPRAAGARRVLGEAFRSAWRAKRRQDGFDRVPANGSATRKSRTAAAMDQFVDQFEAIPVVVLACLKRHREPHPHEGASIYPACQNLLLAAAALGLGGTITLWHVPVEAELRHVLGIPDDVGIAATIPLGHPQGRHGPVRRRPLHELVYEDGWGSPPRWALAAHDGDPR